MKRETRKERILGRDRGEEKIETGNRVRKRGDGGDGGRPGEVNINMEPRNKAETTCPPSGDR
ncbi:hypothetical protein EYF80_018385 [Liparis tanakae]|uniref:Uncharacterized protein n=1 Tax=Liparis tanakae TaxID=230148 RepID=A0A4Z2I075_9TELE|nr:hypothetical protein EYF80_018385 [Liparis tanakae]